MMFLCTKEVSKRCSSGDHSPYILSAAVVEMVILHLLNIFRGSGVGSWQSVYDSLC
jgi:hypothetical protein